MSERCNRTLLDMVRSMMSQLDLPLSFWGYALKTTAFTLNRVPSKSVDKTPYEIWTGKSPSLSFLKIWGCDVYVKRLTSDKLTPSLISASLWGILRKLKDTIFIIRLITKCLLPVMVSSWRKSFFLKESVRARCNSKKFENHLKMFQLLLNLYRMNKMSLNL